MEEVMEVELRRLFTGIMWGVGEAVSLLRLDSTT